jgi:hypothetical protein
LRAKLVVAAAIILILCIAGLCVPAYRANRSADIFLALPAETSRRGIDINRIEDFIEDEFLITYEIPDSDKVSLSNGEYPVTVIGTNPCYPRVLGLPVIEGSFFSSGDWKGKQRLAVLNEKAAFDIFGSSRIAGNRFKMCSETRFAETWLVAGVIGDGDEDHCRLYVPSSIRDGEAIALMALTSGGIDDAHIKNTLKTLGIMEGSYNFFYFETVEALLWERAAVILLLFSALFFLSLLRPLAGKFKASFAVLKGDLERRYPEQVLREDQKIILKPALYALGLALFPCSSLFLFLRLAAVCLPWQDIPSLAYINRGLFYPHLERLCDYEFASRLLFFISLAVVVGLTAGINVLLPPPAHNR